MSWTYVIGWSLLHFLWQGALVAVACAVLLALVGNRSPALRYSLSVAALVVMAAMPFATAMRATAAGVAGEAGEAETVRGARGLADLTPAAEVARDQVQAAVPERTSVRVWLKPRIEAALPSLVLVWLAGVFALSLRLLGGWAWARRLTTTGVRPAPESYLGLARDLAARLRVTRPVRLLESTLVQVPAVVGWLRPTLLFPVSLASGLTPQQIEVLLAHELAHVRRHDYAVNLLQSVIETLLFYHPAVWWLSHRIREEREHCCDDLAVAVTGNPREYAGALLELEQLRANDLWLAAAATGGSLVRRIRRLLAAPPAHGDQGQRWIAGALVVAGVLVTGGGAGLSRSAPEGREEAEGARGAQGAPAPDTVIVVAREGGLQARWNGALEAARRAGFPRFWVGYAIDGGDRDQWLYFDRHTTIFAGEGTIMSGHVRFSGSPSGISTGGVSLYPLLGARPPEDLAVLLSFVGGNGRPVLDRLHLSSYAIPVHFAGLPVLWLGDADDAESVALMRGYFDGTASRNLREDLLSVIGAHADARVVVPMLTQWLQGGEPDDLRVSAAEWLGYHPDPAALTALARAARQDRSGRVRAEAAESVGDVGLPAASDTLIALARTLQDHAARLEAVESLGEREDGQTLDALRDLIRSDPSAEVQRKAVETLGDRHDDRAMQVVKETAESHARRDVRVEALETLADAAQDVSDPAQSLEVLGRVAQQDASVDIQRAAVEALGGIDDPRARRLLLEIAQQHPRYEVRMTAVETLGESAAPAEAFDALVRIARTDPHPDVQARAAETLGELEDQRVPAALEAIIRDHPRVEVRLHSVETYADHAEPEAAVRFLKSLIDSADRREVRFRALESLGDLEDGAGIDAVIEILRATSDREIQRKALEVLGDSDHPRAISVLEELIKRP